MADAPDTQTDATEQESTKPRKGKLGMILVILGVMAIEGVGVFALTKFLSPAPPEARAADGGQQAGEGDPDGFPAEDVVEIELADCRVSNRQGAKVTVVSIKVTGLIRVELREKMVAMVERMRSRIDDRVSFVLRGASQQTFAEPGLQTLKRQLSSELDRLFGETRLFLDVLVPEFYQTIE